MDTADMTKTPGKVWKPEAQTLLKTLEPEGWSKITSPVLILRCGDDQ